MSHASTAPVDTASHRRIKPRNRRPSRNWVIAAGVVVVFVAGLVGLLDGLVLLPLTAPLLAFTTRAGQPVSRSGGTVAVAVLTAIGYLAVAGPLTGLGSLRLPMAAVTPILIALQLVSMLVVALPLALPVPDDRTLPV